MSKNNIAIQWYPGHIAKAERALTEQLKRVDVVFDVRDIRIPHATHHPNLDRWVGNRGRVLVLNRMDTVSREIQQGWKQWFLDRGETPYLTNAKLGKGIAQVQKAAIAAGAPMNEKRRSRGMLPRPVRAVVVGFPNVGKSALINRLLKRKVVESAARPGVTRQLRWIKISPEIELLDAPGVIPSLLENQDNAVKLAICDDIGSASYDNQRVAIGLLEHLEELSEQINSWEKLRSRYEIDPAGYSSEDYLHALAKEKHLGDLERAACQLLSDFRKGNLGALPLELPPQF
ncbi:ribosome biogenesis GTPase YlqF [Roseofilum casamattae]|uniref:Ribosome biogenesis GTPase A n=1 Tax=Roseofilum casamattae BLCC-M143 TaxID=3022442 RepID=A0ABT7BW63_9CYAN|nr:ribosome biogenesis GTPase YlqF [Roseofilum casamattae]MDJ1183433.1 ribosome biogenesis GTPase YlqF [Roseofilum casamattae BLCC-M143]